MQRRHFNSLSMGAVSALIGLAGTRANAIELSDLSNADASKGLKAALEKGALSAVSILGAQDGFLGNDQVRIPLPGFLNDAAGLLRTFGQGNRYESRRGAGRANGQRVAHGRGSHHEFDRCERYFDGWSDRGKHLF